MTSPTRRERPPLGQLQEPHVNAHSRHQGKTPMTPQASHRTKNARFLHIRAVNAAVLSHSDDDFKYYIAALADDFEVAVPVGETTTCEAVFDENQEPLELLEGMQVPRGYLWSRRNTAQRKYELWGAEYASHVPPRRRKRNARTGFLLEHFPMSVVLQAGFHMKPVASNATREEK